MIAIAARQKKKSDAYDARYGVAARLRVCLLSSGPTMPPTSPPASTYEIAFALKSALAASAAAKR